jgi:Tir chaperone family protein CesT
MKTVEDIESFLLRAGLPYEAVKPGLWLVQIGDHGRLAVSLAGPVVAFRIKVLDTPKQGGEDLYRILLQLNTTEMVHGAFGIEGEAIVIVDALELENLDFNEFQAVIDDMSMAVTKHHPNLARYVDARPPQPSAAPHA